jgi:hypothetical protein
VNQECGAPITVGLDILDFFPVDENNLNIKEDVWKGVRRQGGVEKGKVREGSHSGEGKRSGGVCV